MLSLERLEFEWPLCLAHYLCDVYLFICSLIQQTFIRCLLCAMPGEECWGPREAQGRSPGSPLWSNGDHKVTQNIIAVCVAFMRRMGKGQGQTAEGPALVRKGAVLGPSELRIEG